MRLQGSEGHAGTAVAQEAGQDAAVQLVELHELQQVGEAGLALVHAEVQAARLLALGYDHSEWAVREGHEPEGLPPGPDRSPQCSCREKGESRRPRMQWRLGVEGGATGSWVSCVSTAGI